MILFYSDTAKCAAPLKNICSGMSRKHWFTSGFRSLCTTPASCMKLTADTRLCSSWLASASPNSFFLLILSSNSPPLKSSITKYVWYWHKDENNREFRWSSCLCGCHINEMCRFDVQNLISVSGEKKKCPCDWLYLVSINFVQLDNIWVRFAMSQCSDLPLRVCLHPDAEEKCSQNHWSECCDTHTQWGMMCTLTCGWQSWRRSPAHFACVGISCTQRNCPRPEEARWDTAHSGEKTGIPGEKRHSRTSHWLSLGDRTFRWQQYERVQHATQVKTDITEKDLQSVVNDWQKEIVNSHGIKQGVFWLIKPDKTNVSIHFLFSSFQTWIFRIVPLTSHCAGLMQNQVDRRWPAPQSLPWLRSY